MLAPPSHARVEDQTGDLPPLSDARAVADEEARARRDAVLRREKLLVPLARVEHALELQLRELAFVHDPLWERLAQRERRWRQLHRPQRRRLNYVARMRLTIRQ